MPYVEGWQRDSGVVKGAEEGPLNLLTEHFFFAIIHRRAGGTCPPVRMVPHADSHKYCPLGRCGTRPGPYEGGVAKDYKGATKFQKITAWRKAKALANRAYLEENVYDNAAKKGLGRSQDTRDNAGRE